VPYTVWTFSFLTRECEEELQRAQVALATPHRPTWKSTTPWRLKQSMPHRFRALPVILEILKSSFQMDRDFLANRHVSEKAASRFFVSRTDLPGRRLLNELLHPIQGPEFTKAEVAPLRMLMGSTFGWWARPRGSLESSEPHRQSARWSNPDGKKGR
jgi:hypothetical protein